MEQITSGSYKRVVVLADKRWRSAPSPWVLLVPLLVIPAVIFVYLFMVIFPDATWAELFAKISEKVVRFDWATVNWGKAIPNLIMLGLVVGQFIYLRWAKQRERLTLSPDGIRYTSALPDSLKRFYPGWSVSWSEIGKAELIAPQAHLVDASLVGMTLHTPSGKRHIRPAVWIDPQTYARPARFSLKLKPMAPSRDEIGREVMASEVVRYMAEHAPHLVIDAKLDKTTNAHSLEKDPHGRIAIGIVVLLMLYAFIDAIVGPDSYIDPPASLLHIYIAAGVVGAILAWFWLRRSALMVMEKIGLAVLIGALVGVAMLPGALRINALTDASGVGSYRYLVTYSADGVVLRPVNDGLPNIDYFARHRYWDKYAKGEIYPVQVHKGILGFYQFNSSVIIDDINSH